MSEPTIADLVKAAGTPGSWADAGSAGILDLMALARTGGTLSVRVGMTGRAEFKVYAFFVSEHGINVFLLKEVEGTTYGFTLHYWEPNLDTDQLGPCRIDFTMEFDTATQEVGFPPQARTRRVSTPV